jgi:precorrin-8X/cobalt-precorrin-8 methylmutase
MALFDAYLMVDWSAANTPTLGQDSIWIAHVGRSGNGRPFLRWLRNVATRAEAMKLIATTMRDSVSRGERLLAGFDFAFGYPAGAAEAMAGHASWDAVWRALAQAVEDDRENRSNRFAAAAAFNARAFGGDALFWGHPRGQSHNGLSPTKTSGAYGTIGEKRHVERRVVSAKSVWQLCYTGSVGSQTLLGIAALETLRNDPSLAQSIAVWPFETAFAASLDKPIIVAEIYPSLFEVAAFEGEIRDAAQVRCVALTLAALDAQDRLIGLLACPDDLDGTVRHDVLTQEGWIVGAGRAKAELRVAPSSAPDYVRDPDAIYRQSFATIEAEADFVSVPKALHAVAVRVIHACGMVDVVDDFHASPDAAQAGEAALTSGAPILCDVEMVRHGIIAARLPAANDVVCMLNDARTRPLATRLATTRSAAQVDLWVPRLAGAIVVIGNAPTALFRLLELLDAGAPKPALIIAMPVGFVGAAESKAALAEDPRGIPFITVSGRRGGSAMASAALNALAGGARGA